MSKYSSISNNTSNYFFFLIPLNRLADWKIRRKKERGKIGRVRSQVDASRLGKSGTSDSIRNFFRLPRIYDRIFPDSAHSRSFSGSIVLNQFICTIFFISFIIATKVQNIRRIKQITVQASLQIIYFPIQSNLLFFSRIQFLRISVKITVHWDFHLVHNTCNSCSILHFSKQNFREIYEFSFIKREVIERNSQKNCI